MTKQITKAEVRAELKRIAAEKPDAVNPFVVSPFGFTSCLYRKGRGGSIKRCIIGQLGYNLGLPTPEPDAGSVEEVAFDGVWAELFTPKAVEYMSDVQRAADGAYADDPIPWGQVKL